MENKKTNIQIGILIAIVLVAAFARLIPVMPNFSPLLAIGLFGAAHFARRWQAVLVPLLASWLSDLYINNVIYKEYYPDFTFFYTGCAWQYGCYLAVAVLGLIIYNKNISILNVFGGAVGASLLFFIVSNFGVWVSSAMYPHTSLGLATCYAAGLPFIKGTLLGTSFYATVLFGGYYLLQRQYSILRMDAVMYA